MYVCSMLELIIKVYIYLQLLQQHDRQLKMHKIK